MGVRRLSLALVFALAPAAHAASADPSLIPEMDAHRPAAKAPPAPRRPTPVSPAEEVVPAAPAPADPRPKGPRRDLENEVLEAPRRPWFALRERTWFMHGSVDERYSQDATANFTVTQGLGPPRTGTSENARLKGIMPVLEAEVAPLSWLALVGEYGVAADANPGTGVSTWVDATKADILTNNGTGAVWNDPGHAEYLHQSFGGTSAKTTWQSASVALRIVDSHGGTQGRMEYDHSIDLLLGAHRFRDEFTMTNGLVDLNSGQVAGLPAAGTYTDGPLYTKTLTWRGPHAGIQAETSLPEGFRLDAQVLYSPLMEYRGTIYDALNGGNGVDRAQSPNIQEWAHGTAVHFRVGAGWHWGPVSVDGGFMRLYFYSRTGRRRTYAADGSSSDVQLDHAVTERSGMYAGASFRY